MFSLLLIILKKDTTFRNITKKTFPLQFFLKEIKKNITYNNSVCLILKSRAPQDNCVLCLSLTEENTKTVLYLLPSTFYKLAHPAATLTVLGRKY